MNIILTVLLAALAGLSTLAQAQSDLPAAVGRISAVQGQVTLSGDDEPVAASLNWPVTANSHLVTASGARTEFRIGSTAVRLDGDSDLEITQLDDDLLRLRLNYGSASIRVRNADLLRDFELTTPQARITMIEPGLLRVDVERVPDTSQISVLAGIARVDGAGSSVTVNPGRQVDVTTEDVRTTVARRDGFDVWADERDRLADVVVTTQYVSTGMTGYEELDRHGSWTENVEYGPLWAPRNVAADWAPYRDGRWTWLAPWGWTWVDNAPWGYAPSHYGRWVTVRQRWYWAPGRPAGRPVWAPALVGWVGGVNRPNQGPGLGWYPLTPRDRFVPGYRVSSSYEQRLSWSYKGKSFTPRGDHDVGRNGGRDGLTVLPRAQFEGRNIIRVNRGDHFVPRPQQGNLVTPATPPRPPAGPGRIETNRNWQDRDGNGRPDRFDNNPRNGNNPRADNNPRNDNNPRADNNPRNDNNPRFGNNPRSDNTPRADNNPRNDNNPRGDNNPRNDNNPRFGNNPRNDNNPNNPRNDNNPRAGNNPRNDLPRNDSRPQTISTLPPNQIGTPDAPAQTINPRDVGVEIHTRPYGGRAGNGALMPAPVLQIGNTRDRFQRDDNDRRQRDEEERRQRERDRQSQQQTQPQQPQQPRPQQPQAQPQQQPQPQAQQPERPRFQPQQERPQQQERPRFQPPQERPQQQERPQSRPERPQQQERPQAQQPRPAPQPQAQPQQRNEPGAGRQSQHDRPREDRM